MNNYTNPYSRLQTYYGWLSSSSDNLLGMSILELHNHTQIPLPVIRQDIVAILEWEAKIAQKYVDKYPLAIFSLENYISFDLEAISDITDSHDEDTDTSDDSEDSNSDSLENRVSELECGNFEPELREQLLNGDLDEIPFLIDNYHSGGLEHFDIALSYDESLALDAVFKDLGTKQPVHLRKPSFLQIKDSYRAIHDYRELSSRLELIDNAIREQKPLYMAYKNSKGHTQEFSFQPLKISYDETENLYCVLSVFHGNIQVHRLDRIQGLWPGKEKVEAGDVSIIDNLAPQVWGNCFSEEPQHVKIKFYNEANVWNKVKRDLVCRTKGQLYEKDGFLYYEDTVYGISKFRPWIYSFGSSAIVLEPKSLRDHIIASLKERKDRDQF